MTPNNQKIYVNLGRLGDICNILPLLYDDHVKGTRSAMMVARDFAGQLSSGCSYYDEVVFNGSMWDLDKAVKEADNLSSNVVVTQLVGPTEVVKSVVINRNGLEYRTTTESFMKDAWMIAGRFEDWKKQLPLVFDKRSAEREKRLCEPIVKKKPIILVATKGVSAPFAYSPLLWELVSRRFGNKFNVVNLSDIVAERFYDLLGLYERAACLVTVDSAPLHLAYACKNLPVVALVRDKPSLWHGSCWRPNHICHIRYSEFPERCVEMLDAIAAIGKPGNWFAQRINDRKILHAWSQYEAYDEESHKEACSTWNNAYESKVWVSCPIEPGAVGRDTHHLLKDEKRLCFVKDLLRLATMRSEPNDIICLTRPDTHFSPDITDILLSNPMCYAHRIEKNRIFPMQQSWHPAVDLIAFTSKWWVDNQGQYPDFVLGKDPYWHRVFFELLKKAGAVDITEAVWRPQPPAMPASDPGKELPIRVLHNEKLYNSWMGERGMELMFPIINDQLETMPLNRRGLFQYGYNPSIIKHNDRTLLAYRWHRDGTASTKLAMAELDTTGNAITNTPVTTEEDHSTDDPRMFMVRDELYMSYVLSTWPKIPTTSVVRYGKTLPVKPHTIKGSFQPAFGRNDWSAMEKNWVFFGYEDKIYVIYQSQPEQVVFELSGIVNKDPLDTPALTWKWGEIKGGTIPVPYNGRLLRFFHSTLDNEPPPWRRRYYLGAMVMEATPPFKQLAISRKPVARGSEGDELTPMERLACIHRKPKVIFPAGCIPLQDGWCVSCGINDCCSVLLHVHEKDLNL